MATAFTLQAQSTALPAPTSDGFASSPQDTLPVFQAGTSTLCYATGDKRIVSRDATKQDSPTARGTSHGGEFSLSGDQPWSRFPLMSWAYEAVVNLSGTMAAAPDGTMIGIWPKDAPPAESGDAYVQPAHLGPASYGEQPFPGADTVPSNCRPAEWPDDHTLICTNASNFYRIRFDAAFTRAEAVERLLPDTDRNNHDVVLSPDGKAIAFLSEPGSNIDLYRLDLAPGATPQKITGVQSAAVSTQGERN
ncbi:hypothetical protein [Kitasatospora sp. NPDC059571]|uniref:hypothetical protein n=1 Tax=Kitasatospora sp. NPDC059571 TaxID=3346871 RepID=UPI0036A7AE3F